MSLSVTAVTAESFDLYRSFVFDTQVHLGNIHVDQGQVIHQCQLINVKVTGTKIFGCSSADITYDAADVNKHDRKL